ncbi:MULTISPECIES: very short patch repair endonuclease [unclassified Serratia (in: enterobacteria)]|uniref:very short patch repair endonuclease n=1 Tax=unclassified Serratia (in: enterobacteria) TaxID=2647522 RepID=UPI00210197EF|nr:MULTISPECIES: DNA mismatch endonuclease Vsr [unclassified Serratia (in: enterobacteria)]
MDVHSKQQRARNMRAIRSKNTIPEKMISEILFSLDVDYTSQNNSIYGKPDFLCSDYKSAIFVHGCFWHRHLCYMFKWPKTRPAFWVKKLTQNVRRDHHVINKLNQAGFKVLVIWECSLRGKVNIPTYIIRDYIEEWLCASDDNCEISSLGIKTLSRS